LDFLLLIAQQCFNRTALIAADRSRVQQASISCDVLAAHEHFGRFVLRCSRRDVQRLGSRKLGKLLLKNRRSAKALNAVGLFQSPASLPLRLAQALICVNRFATIITGE
jgi:hypothetical protein